MLPEAYQYSVRGPFVIELYEIKEKELKNIQRWSSIKILHENVNIRIIKPDRQFYNTLIQIGLKFGLGYLSHVDIKDYISAVQHQIGKRWSLGLVKPIEFFFDTCRNLESELKEHGVMSFFKALKAYLMKAWNIWIVKNARIFKKAGSN